MRERLTGPRLLLLSFAALIALGTGLLSLPVSSVTGESVGWVDALFTATSAVCVTGLASVDTATHWSGWGRLFLLLLIQVGGLGILTLSTFVAHSLGRRVSITSEQLLSRDVAPLGVADAHRIVRMVVAFTLSIELLGALFLWIAWRNQMSPGEAVWEATFHSVSAFCNAGFSTLPRGLEPYRGDWLVNATIMVLVVTGGLGFVVLVELANWRRTRRRLSLHSRIVLLATAGLIVVGAIGYYALERENSLASAGTGTRVVASLFASVTARTAGFSTIDYGHLTTPALTLTVLLMFIGGSPGSCAGGVKTTTFVVLLASARSALQGRKRPTLMRRTIPPVAVRQAQVLALLGFSVVLFVPFFLELTEKWSAPYYESSVRYMELSFEAASAFATAGLSTGVTPTLSAAGKMVLIVLMFCGRVGLLTLTVSIARRRRRGFRYAEENVLIG